MGGSDSRVCPSPEVLGAFIEGTADPVTRRTVQRHVTDCPECVFIVGDTSRYLSAIEEEEAAEAEEDAPRPRRWRRALAAAAVAVVCLLGAWYATARRDPLQRVREVAAAVPTRRVEARLDGFPHRRYSAVRSDAAPLDPALRIEAERVVRLDRHDADGWHARGVSALLLGRTAESIAMLQKAADLDPRNVRYWSDLAAAHLAVNDDRGDAHVRAALTATGRAIALDPTLPAAQFNHALALSRLGDRARASDAWSSYLALDRASAWSTEATARRDSLF
jgi:tetratricopeptide (TPR) repeat protein